MSILNLIAILYLFSCQYLFSHRKFREALILFDEMREKDKVAYTNAVRAAEHTSFTRVEELLHKALADLGPTSSTQVFNAALANMKFLDRNTTENSAPVEGVLIPEVNSYVIVDRARKLLDWMVQSKITVSSQTMDTYLNVVCAHGNEKLVEDAILLRQQFNLAASDYTLNIVMAYYLSSNKPFNEVIFLLRSLIMKWNVQPDAVTVNTLLKNCVSTKNLKDIDQVLALMTEWDIQPNRWTNELLLEIDGLRGNADSAFRLVENMSDSELTPHMISSALNLCDNSTSVLRLTKRALALGVADSTVVVTAVKKLVATGEFENAHHVLRSLWQQGTQLDKYVLSSMLSAVFLECRTLLEGKQIVATGEPIQGRVVLLRQYLQTVKISQPYLLTSSICQRVVRELIELGDCDAACSIHLQLFPRCTVQTELLTALFQGLQDSCTTAASSNDSEYALNLAKKGLALFHIYAFSNSTSLKNDGSFEDHKVYPLSLLRSIHVNNVFKLLSTAKLYDFSEKLFHILSHHQFVEQVEPSVSRLRLGRTLLPTVFTIAELVRTGRASGRVALTRNAILWGIESETYLPLDLVRDAMSLIYAKGEVGMVRTLYDRLYRAGRVNHWVDAKGAALEEPVVDLHYFSRGMAYAAINCAIREVSYIRYFLFFLNHSLLIN